MASTVFDGACLEIHLRVKLFSASGALAAHVKVPCPSVELHGPAAKVSCAIICSGRLPRIHQFHIGHNRSEWNERMRTASFHSNRPNKIKIS